MFCTKSTLLPSVLTLRQGKPDLANIDELTSASDLCYPATTKADKLAEEIKRARTEPGMTVIFSTYQSIEVSERSPNTNLCMDEIGLIICDEAHRTAGGHYQMKATPPSKGSILTNSLNAEKTSLYDSHSTNLW